MAGASGRRGLYIEHINRRKYIAEWPKYYSTTVQGFKRPDLQNQFNMVDQRRIYLTIRTSTFEKIKW
jgi:hypothetical protein